MYHRCVHHPGKRMRSVLIVALTFAFALLHPGVMFGAEARWRAPERAVAENPSQAIQDAERDLRTAQERNDKSAELNAILLFLAAREVLDPSGSPPYLERLERAMLLAQELGDNETSCKLVQFKAVPSFMELSEKTDSLTNEAINVAQQNSDRCLADAYIRKAILETAKYHSSEAMLFYDKAYRMYEKQHDDFGMARALSGIAGVYGGPESPPENQKKTIEYLNRASAILNPQKYRAWGVQELHRLGLAYYRINNFSEAKNNFQRSLELARELNFHGDVGLGNYRLGELAMDEGRLDDAFVHFNTALPDLQKVGGYVEYYAAALTGYARVLGRLGRNKDSLDALVRAESLLPQAKSARAEWLYHRSAAEVFALLGNYRRAFEALTALRELDGRMVKAANDKVVNELKVGMEVHLKDAENNLLRAREKQSDAQRLALTLGLALALALLIGAGVLAFLLRQRAATAKLLAQRHLALAAAEQRANQAKSSFLANMSHELRSPLNAILGFTDLALRSPDLPSSVKGDLSTVAKSGEHLYALINQVLDLSKVEAGRATVEEANFDLYGLLDELIDTFDLGAKSKGLQLTLDVEPQTPQYVCGDVVKLRQVLINLTNNALKFTREGGVVLHVGVVQMKGVPSDQCRLSFAVIDSGSGIAPAELARLGEAFVQAQAGRDSRQGTGLGLAISRGFVELMGGELRFSSEEGKGTTISFVLPMHIVSAESAHLSESKTTRRVVALAPDQPVYRILAVDDRPEGRQLLVRLLSSLGFEVREASNGQEAVSLWESWEPHLIWMDMRMPVMDGREATRRIKAIKKGHAPIVIALTASSFEEERQEIIAVGCDDFLRKPFRQEALFDMMRRFLGVEFLYEDMAPPPSVQLPDKAQLRAIPIELRLKLKLALTGLDDDGIEKAIKDIESLDPTLSERLDVLVKDYKHRLLISLIDDVAVSSATQAL